MRLDFQDGGKTIVEKVGSGGLLLISDCFSLGSLLDFLKDRGGQNLSLPHLVDMAAQVNWASKRHLPVLYPITLHKPHESPYT